MTFAIIDNPVSQSDLIDMGAKNPRYVTAHEIFFVYEGDLDHPVTEKFIALSERGVKEPPYFTYPRKNLHLEEMGDVPSVRTSDPG